MDNDAKTMENGQRKPDNTRWYITGIIVLLLVASIWLYAGSNQDNRSIATDRADVERVQRVAFTMGTVVEIVVEGKDAQIAVDTAINEMHRLTGFYDRFHPHSDISRLNAAQGEWVSLSPESFTILSESIALAEMTDGAFDPTIASLIDLWGFIEVGTEGHTNDSPSPNFDESKSPTRLIGTTIPYQQAIDAALLSVGYRYIEVDHDTHRARIVFEPSDTSSQAPDRPGIDLGAIAKGFAADIAADILRSFDIDRAIIDMGGDILVIGNRNAAGDPWRLGLKHPREDGVLAVVYATDQAVATSGDYERYFEVDGKRYTHIIDPRTGWPAEELMSATVIAPTGAMADALATAVFVLGVDEGQRLLDQIPGTGAILVTKDGDLYITESIQVQVELR